MSLMSYLISCYRYTNLNPNYYFSILFQAKLESPTESEVSLPSQPDAEEESRTSSSSMTIKRLNSIPCACEGSPMPVSPTTTRKTTTPTASRTITTTSTDSIEARSIAESVLVDVLSSMFDDLSTKTSDDVQTSNDVQKSGQKAVRPSDIEIDCSQADIEIRISPRHRRSAPPATVRSESSDSAEGHQRHHRGHHHHRSQEPENVWSKSENTTR